MLMFARKNTGERERNSRGRMRSAMCSPIKRPGVSSTARFFPLSILNHDMIRMAIGLMDPKKQAAMSENP
jgi:hypothetical protein